MRQPEYGTGKNRYISIAIALMTAVMAVSSPCPEINAAEEDSSDEVMLTGTQQALADKETDPDEDIRNEILEDIGDESETISIRTADDLIKLALNCRLDTWSVNKHVVLNADISMLGMDFAGIPTFGGVFDGRGHTISNLNITEDRSYTGLFIYLQETAVVRNLKVNGRVISGSGRIGTGGIVGSNSGIIRNCDFDGVIYGGDYSGGIAGFNELHGQIISCEARGYVGGNHFIGGITGENIGNVEECVNNSYVNTSYEEATVSLKDIKLETYINSVIPRSGTGDDREKINTLKSIYDTGGIAGLSIGVIGRCVNNGDIGYEQVGYNTGGIAGRQSGYIYGCENSGLILGRKDVGGIVGQAEPYVTIDMSQDIAEQLTENISILRDQIDKTLGDAGVHSDAISDRLSVIQRFTGQALDDTRYLADGTVSFVNGVTGSVNEAFSRVGYILSESSKDSGAMDQVIYATDNAAKAGQTMSETVNDLDIYQFFSDEDKKTYDNSSDILSAATEEYSGYLSEAETAFKNYYIWKQAVDSDAADGLKDLAYLKESGDYTFNVQSVTVPADKAVPAFSWSADNYPENPSGDKQAFFDAFGIGGTWYHHRENGGAYEDVSYPVTDSEETHEQYLKDTVLRGDSIAKAAEAAADYADKQYLAKHGTYYAADAATAAENMTAIVLKYLPEMSEETRSDAEAAVSYLSRSVQNLRGAESETKRITGEIAAKGDIAFPQLDSSYRAHTVSLADNLQGMNDNFGLLNSEMNGAGDSLLLDLSDINDQFNKIMMLYSDAIDGVLDRDYSNTVEDDSFKVAENCTDATVDGCINKGGVKSDIDTGGIAGTMAIEYDFDPESDVTGISDANLNTTYITKCVLRNCTNQADIDGNKSYVSGVCALQEMGTILGCSSYADIRSGSGEYSGGIAGQSLSYIKGCYVKGDIVATQYAGGIAGDGNNIMDCLSQVTIYGADNWYGAIAGHVAEEGKIRNNYFVGDDLAGIDRVSYSCKAEPVEYRALFDLEDIEVPKNFANCMVTFLLDDEDELTVIEKRPVEYHSALTVEDYPNISERKGYYIEWDKTELGRVDADTKVTAHFVKNLTTLAGSELNGNGQSKVLVDGSFKAEDSIVVDKNITEAGTIYDNTLVIEGFTIVIPNDGSDIHTVRYALDDDYLDDWEKIINVYEEEPDGSWKLLENTRLMGRYLLFDADGSSPHIQIRMDDYKKVIAKSVGLIILAAAGGILVLALIIKLIIKRRSRIVKAAKVIREKTIDAAQNLGGQELFYHAEEDRFGNEVVHKEEAPDAEDGDEAPDAADGDETPDVADGDEAPDVAGGDETGSDEPDTAEKDAEESQTDE